MPQHWFQGQGRVSHSIFWKQPAVSNQQGMLASHCILTVSC